jgi:hypothetical protein
MPSLDEWLGIQLRENPDQFTLIDVQRWPNARQTKRDKGVAGSRYSKDR